MNFGVFSFKACNPARGSCTGEGTNRSKLIIWRIPSFWVLNTINLNSFETLSESETSRTLGFGVRNVAFKIGMWDGSFGWYAFRGIEFDQTFDKIQSGGICFRDQFREVFTCKHRFCFEKITCLSQPDGNRGFGLVFNDQIYGEIIVPLPYILKCSQDIATSSGQLSLAGAPITSSIFPNWAFSEPPGKRGFFVNSSAIMQPTLHKSTALA